MYQKNLKSVVEYINAYDLNNESMVLRVNGNNGLALAFDNAQELIFLLNSIAHAKDWNYQDMPMTITHGYTDIAEYRGNFFDDGQGWVMV